MSAKITAALWQVMNACGYVQKTGKNTFHNYRYAGEADLLEKLRPAMLEAGLLLLPSVESVSAIDEHGIVTVRVAYTLAHKDGDIWPDKIFAAGSGGGKNSKGGVDDKGVYKAITGANKYLLFKLFQIETGDDPESVDEAPAPATRPQPPVQQHSGIQAAIQDDPVEAAMLKAVRDRSTPTALEAMLSKDVWMIDYDKLGLTARARVDAAVSVKRGEFVNLRMAG